MPIYNSEIVSHVGIKPYRWHGAGRLVKCCWHSPAQSLLASSLVDIRDQYFYSPLDIYMYRPALFCV
jgi:hypothetical protein